MTAKRDVVWGRFPNGVLGLDAGQGGADDQPLGWLDLFREGPRIRAAMKAGRHTEARARIVRLRQDLDRRGARVVCAVVYELEANLETREGNHAYAARLFREQVIPRYEGLPSVVSARARRWLEILDEEVREERAERARVDAIE